MQIKIFKNFVTKNSTIRDNYSKNYYSLNKKRINFIFIYIIFVKYKLFLDNLYKYSNIFDKVIYFRLFSLNCFSFYSRKLKNTKFKLSIGLNKNRIFKRFFLNIYKKKLFEFFVNRITAEETEYTRRINKKPLTIAQRAKYNEKRRIKRSEKRSVEGLDEQKELYIKYNLNFNSKLSRLRIFRY